jgi:hypothetical protein
LRNARLHVQLRHAVHVVAAVLGVVLRCFLRRLIHDIIVHGRALAQVEE